MNLNLADWTKRVDPNGETAALGELLHQSNRNLDDIVYVEGNLPTGHRVTVRTGLPTVYFRQYNAGTPTSKSTTAQIDEPLAIIESWSETDIDLLKLNGNKASFMMSETRGFLEAMGQKQASEMLYGNPATDSRAYLGLAPRYSSLSAGNAQNVIDGSFGTASAANQQTSIWLVCWSPETVYCIFPKGSKAGLEHIDLGMQVSFDTGTAGERMLVHQHRFQWQTGVVVQDWRYAARICNLEIVVGGSPTNSANQLTGVHAASTSTNILHAMTIALSRIPNISRGNPVWYMNRTMFTVLMRIALDRGANSGLLIQTATSEFGRPSQELSFMGIAIRQVDAILNTESIVL